jgi:hypothetical protein
LLLKAFKEYFEKCIIPKVNEETREVMKGVVAFV